MAWQNNEGYFVLRYLLIDIPSTCSEVRETLRFSGNDVGTRDPNPVRVFVERAPGVRDNEPVMRWNS